MVFHGTVTKFNNRFQLEGADLQFHVLYLSRYMLCSEQLYLIHCSFDIKLSTVTGIGSGNFFLSEVNNRKPITAIEVNNDTYFLQKRIEKISLNRALLSNKRQ